MAEAATTATAPESGSEATTTEATASVTTETTPPETDEVEKWKALSRKNEADLKKARSELSKAQQASMTEQEKAVAEARDQARTEALAEVQRDRVRDKVEIAAAGRLADPGDAAALLGDLDRFIVSGQIDSPAIAKAIDDLLKAKPYLSPQPGAGAGEGGPRGGAPVALNDDPLLKALMVKTNA